MRLWVAYLIGILGLIPLTIFSYGYGVGGQVAFIGMAAFPFVVGFNYMRKRMHPKQLKTAV